MLTALSIRDIVLIEKLDLVLDQGLTVLSGETGAGKSILLDALGLALGARGDSGLVRAGADKGVVTASFALATDHRVIRMLAEQGIEIDGELIVRRVQGGDGKSRAFVNDQPVGIGLLRQLGAQLAEIHGQHDDRALVDVASHRDLLDAFGGLQPLLAAAGAAWAAWQEKNAALQDQRTRVARAEAEREFLEHSVAELARLAPREREEEELAERRQLMMHAEQFAGLIVEVEKALGGSLDVELNAVLRKIERRAGQAMGKLDALAGALDRLLIEIGEATRAAGEAGREFAFDPGDLERAEERLFALRAAARKHKVKVDDLPAALLRMTGDLQSLVDGGEKLRRLEAEETAARATYVDAAGRLSAARLSAAERLDRAVMAELPPLKLERAAFTTVVESDASRPAAHGIDRVEFMVTANPGVPVAPLTKVASGGELARFMLALKVVLAARGSAPTLIFDEIDTGVGGATADAMGLRLSRLADGLQVVCVTHSPQVAARADHHLLIAKSETKARMVTHVEPLAPLSRREEIARMLSGSQVTDEARAQADRLLSRAG